MGENKANLFPGQWKRLLSFPLNSAEERCAVYMISNFNVEDPICSCANICKIWGYALLCWQSDLKMKVQPLLAIKGRDLCDSLIDFAGAKCLCLDRSLHSHSFSCFLSIVCAPPFVKVCDLSFQCIPVHLVTHIGPLWPGSFREMRTAVYKPLSFQGSTWGFTPETFYALLH